MSTNNMIYKVNPYVTHTITGDKYALRNSMTGLAYKLSVASFDIYSFINEKKSVVATDIVDFFPQFSEENVREVVSYFHANKILLSDTPSDLAVLMKKDTSLFELKDIETENQLCIVGVPFGQGNPYPNSCSNFPDNFRVYIREKRISIKKNNIQTNAITNAYFGITKAYPLSEKAYKYVRDIGNVFISTQNESKRFVYEKIETLSKRLYEDNVPFFLGGDHSISYSTIKAAASFYDDLYIIQFDAHTDTYTSKYDQLHHDEKQHHHANFMSKCLPLDTIKKVYQLGIRGAVNFGFKPLSEKQEVIPCIVLKEMLKQQEIPINIPKESKIYLSIDIDVLDPLYAPGTSTRVPNGLTIDELLKCIRILYDAYPNQFIGFDLVEVSPHLDDATKTTADSAMHIILQIIQRFSYYA